MTYRDVAEAIAWLARVFGFTEHYRYGEPPDGAQMYLGEAWLQLTRARGLKQTPLRLGGATQSLTVFIEDVEGHFLRAKTAGATIVEEPNETVYGEWQYAAQDLDGHVWLFSRHLRNVDPAAWGARLAR